MRPDVYDVVAYGTQPGLRMAVSPSGTGRLTRDALARLHEAGARRISLSIDGPDAATHDAFRGVKGTFERTVAAARHAHEVGLELQVNTTIARHNFDKVRAMAKLLPDLGAVTWSAFFLVPAGRAQQADVLSAEQHEAAFAELYDVWLTAPYDVKTTEAPHFRRFLSQRIAALSPDRIPGKAKHPTLRFPATGDGKGFVFVSHTGEVQPSGFLPLACGNVRRERLIDVYRNHPTMRRLRDPDSFGGKCGACEYNTLCGGSRARAYGFTGDAFAAEPCCIYASSTTAALVQGIHG
jgi:AdoMet-dependent heme synthase